MSSWPLRLLQILWLNAQLQTRDLPLTGIYLLPPVVVSKWSLMGLKLCKNYPAFPQVRGSLHSVNVLVLDL